MIFGKRTRKKAIATAPIAIEFEAQLARDAYASKRLAWVVAFCSLLLAGLAITALILLLPLKQTVPYLTYVDKATGVTQVVDVATVSKITQDEVNARRGLFFQSAIGRGRIFTTGWAAIVERP